MFISLFFKFFYFLISLFLSDLCFEKEKIEKRAKPTTIAQRARDQNAKPSTIQMKLRSFLISHDDGGIDVETFQKEIRNVARVLTIVGRETTIFMNAFVAACCEEFEDFNTSLLPSNEGEAQEWVQDVFRLMTGGKGREPPNDKKKRKRKRKCDYPWRKTRKSKKGEERPLNFLESFLLEQFHHHYTVGIFIHFFFFPLLFIIFSSAMGPVEKQTYNSS